MRYCLLYLPFIIKLSSQLWLAISRIQICPQSWSFTVTYFFLNDHAWALKIISNVYFPQKSVHLFLSNFNLLGISVESPKLMTLKEKELTYCMCLMIKYQWDCPWFQTWHSPLGYDWQPWYGGTVHCSNDGWVPLRKSESVNEIAASNFLKWKMGMWL